MKKNPDIFLGHILECIEAIETYTRRKTKRTFLKNQQLQDSVLRRLEIIGEAVKYLPSDYKRKHSDIPWKKIAGIRDIIIHEYFGVDLHTVWLTVQKDLPIFRDQVENILLKQDTIPPVLGKKNKK